MTEQVSVLGRRDAKVTFGEPIDVRPYLGAKTRIAAVELTQALEAAMGG
jgi:hypothetical protein